jgi:alanyl aminopeptidase
MENAGMVTYGQTIILADPKNDTINRRREYASIAAHELAHQWFGDLVTTNWWNDIWLNEAFATWTEQKILREWKPEWKTAMDDVDAKLFAEREDSLVSARQIRQPIRSKADIGDAFDSITYEKGAAVIGMFENWMGAENFRAGVQNYMRRYAFKTATAGDFLDAVSSGGKRNVTAAFSTFLNQPGVPIVSASVDCKGPKPVVHLQQKRYLPTGSRGSTNSVWSIPVCMRYPGGEQCPLLTTSTADVTLEDASSCPNWLQINSGAKGYYRVDYSAPLLASLSKANLTGPERVDFVGNAAALAKGGRMSAADAMTIAADYANDPERDVVERTINLVAGMSDTLVSENLRPNYQRFVEKTYGAKARELGWRPKPGESDDTRLLRGPLLQVVAIEGGDRQLADEAHTLALAWLDHPESLSPDIAGPVLSTAAYYGDASLARKFLDAALKTQDRQTQSRLIRALASFRDPAAADIAHQALMTGKVDFTSGINLLFAGGQELRGREYRLHWIEQNFDRILQNHPEVFGFPTASYLPRVGEGMCTTKERTQYTAFFAPRASKIPGTQRAYDQSLESIDLCIAQVAAERPSLESFLARY